MYDDFSFRGEHVSAYGAMAFLGESFAVGSRVSRGEYALPGGGSVILGQASHGTITRTVEIVPLDGVDDTAGWRRRLLSWLYGGRGWLVWDHDPRVRMRAQFDAEGTAGARVSAAGGVSLKCTVYGLCEDAQTTIISVNTQGTDPAQLRWNAGSAVPSPLRIVITNTEDTALRIARVKAGDQEIYLSGMSIARSGTLTLQAEDGETPAAIYENGNMTFAHVRQWGHIAAQPGDVIEIMTGTAAHITCEGRGKWIVG